MEGLLLAYKYKIYDVLPTAFYDIYIASERLGLGRDYDFSPLDVAPELLRYYIKGRAIICSKVLSGVSWWGSVAKMSPLQDECEVEPYLDCHRSLQAWYSQKVKAYQHDHDFMLAGMEKILDPV